MFSSRNGCTSPNSSINCFMTSHLLHHRVVEYPRYAWPVFSFHDNIDLGLWLKRLIHQTIKDERCGGVNFSPTRSSVCEKHVLKATILQAARSCMAATRRSEPMLYWAESVLISSSQSLPQSCFSQVTAIKLGAAE